MTGGSDIDGRRLFCARAALAAAAVWLAPARLGAQHDAMPLPTIKAETSGATVRVATAGTALAPVGGVARVVSTLGSILVTRIGQAEFSVFSATCSHEACQITDGDADAFVCPCHGSRFDRHGAVLMGPAELPLYPFVFSFADDLLTITVA
jgi:cytochrome b6-f complex iron-sulfur subunit